MSGSEWIDDDDDAIVMDGTEEPNTGWSDRLKSAKAENGEKIYDPKRCYTAWLTVPDSLWTEVRE